MEEKDAISISDVMTASTRIIPYVRRTPLVRAVQLEKYFNGAEIWLKMENLQYTGSFKVRGVCNKMLNLSQEELMRGVTAASSGNHAQAVSYMAKKLGTNATIVMPENAPKSKIAGARGYGAEVVLCGFTGEERDAKCDELIRERGFSLVHSHMDPYVIAGHATTALEVWEQMNGQLDELVLPCGAGSLSSGAAFAMKNLAPSVVVTAVEPTAVPRFTESIKAGHPVTVEMKQTMADGLRVSKAEKINFELIRDYVDNLLLVDEDAIAKAVRAVVLYGKITAEPSGCVGIAATLNGQIDTSAGRKLCFVISGGNIDQNMLADLMSNHMENS